MNQSDPPDESGATAERRIVIPRIEFRIERLRTLYRCTYAFHAREVRFERDTGEGFENAFPETFSFHVDRHDPAELYLRFEDLWTQPALLAARAVKRDSEELVLRLLSELPASLSELLKGLATPENSAPLLRASEDVAVFALVVLRFIHDKDLDEHPRLRFARFHWRRLVWKSLLTVMEAHVRPEYVAGYRDGRVDPERSADPYDTSFLYALASGEAERIDPQLVGAAELAFIRWLDEVCLDEDNRAFETGSSPFADRETEVLGAIRLKGTTTVNLGRDLTPFLRRRSRDSARILKRLEHWFLRQYDIHHAAAMLSHGDALQRGDDDGDRVLSRHSAPNYALALAVPSLPFLAAVFAYDRWPHAFDVLASLEVGLVLVTAIWFLAYRFMWRKDLILFHASVPRIGAGIIVGYLPVFLIDEVWDLAEQAPVYILSTIALLGTTTLLYIYVEVQRRLGDPNEAFARARAIFLLGLVLSAGFGLMVTSLLGPLMAARNWGTNLTGAPIEVLAGNLQPFAGELPRVLGIGPLYAFPTAVLLMTFMAFFIGTFLQLLWEDAPFTEPL
ncbi:MAG: hypothetical protein JRH01_02680 [Deltaproteobacteria bacterium]|nr:hypothetical protein [Deltaproteobacteria bacterium]MBW2394395.1 hypothetical protein [Deltaproteobacteria bacterium]